MSPSMEGFLEQHPEARDGVLGAIPLGFIGDAEQHIGPAVVWLCSDRASLVTGTAFQIDLGSTAGVTTRTEKS